ncbi:MULTISPECIES: TniQ family protein [Methylophaga]|uniref:TniQ family protein n=1 Tax=Methylophaga TaxID=40222 RepID=UPI0017690DCF|nr:MULTISPECIES: TniQ family protein [Methylophaga]HIC46205.1 hypothetical protein [Methylophaga sp.]
MRPLIVRPAPKENESLMGYLLRLTEENFFQSPLNLIMYAEAFKKNNKASINDFIKSIASGLIDFDSLSAITGENKKELEIKCYRLLCDRSDGSQSLYLFLNAQIPSNLIRFNYPRFCPDCMRIDPYHRFYWDFVPLTGCPIHKKLLMDVCPECHQQLTWSRSSISTCSHCGFDLFSYSGIDIPDNQMDHIYMIAKAFQKCDSRDHKLILFSSMESYEAIKNFVIRHFSLTERRHFIHFKRKLSVLSPPLLLKNLPYSPLPIIKTNDFIDLQLPRPKFSQLDKIRTIQQINEYLCYELFIFKRTNRINIDDVLQWQPNAEVHQKMVNFFTGQNVPLLVNYSSSKQLTTRQKARHFGVKNIAYRFPSRMNSILDTNSSFFERRHDIINSINASKYLGISEHLLRQLTKAKILHPISGPEIDGFGDTVYSLKYFQVFMDSLLALKELNISEEETISLDEYIKTYDISRRKSLVEIINAIFDKKIKVFDVPTSRLSHIILSLKCINDFCPQPSVSSGYISVNTIASKIGIYTDAIYRTLEAGLLPFKADGRKKLILIEDYERFNEQFVFIKEIASKHKCNPTNLADKLIDEGIRPISGPKIDNNIVYIFRRVDIENVDIKKIVSKNKYKANTGRIAKSDHSTSYHKLIEDMALMTTSEAAHILDISSQMLGKLLKAGEISLYQNPLLPAYKKYLKTADLNDYISRYRENPNLIEYSAAAKFMGESPERFQSTWVKYKRITTIDDGLKNKYVNRESLEKLKLFKNEAISIQEASELKGIDRSYFSNLIKLNKIQPVSGPGVDEYGNYFLNRQEIEKHRHENWW